MTSLHRTSWPAELLNSSPHISSTTFTYLSLWFTTAATTFLPKSSVISSNALFLDFPFFPAALNTGHFSLLQAHYSQGIIILSCFSSHQPGWMLSSQSTLWHLLSVPLSNIGVIPRACSLNRFSPPILTYPGNSLSPAHRLALIESCFCETAFDLRHYYYFLVCFLFVPPIRSKFHQKKKVYVV